MQPCVQLDCTPDLTPRRVYLYISFNAAATSFLGDKDLRGPSAEIGCAIAINKHAVVGDFSFWKTNITYLAFGLVVHFRLQIHTNTMAKIPPLTRVKVLALIKATIYRFVIGLPHKVRIS